MTKRTQHVVPNNVARCCVEMLRAFGQALRCNWNSSCLTFSIPFAQEVPEFIFHALYSTEQDLGRQKELAKQRLVAWQQKNQSEMNKLKEKLVALETGAQPAPVSSMSVGILQVRSMKECKLEKSPSSN